MFADSDLRERCDVVAVSDYPSGLIAVLEGDQPGGWIYVGGLENHPTLVDRWSRVRPLLGNPGSVLRRVRNPRLVADALRSAGLRPGRHDQI